MNQTNQTIINWHTKAQISYTDSYIALWISFNAWYRGLNRRNDRENLNELKNHNLIEQLLSPTAKEIYLRHARDIFDVLAERPLVNLTRPHVSWDGKLENPNDWPGMTEYWYTVRNNLFHGSKNPESDRDNQITELAYKSLNVVMSAIVADIQRLLGTEEIERITELRDIRDMRERRLHDYHGDDVNERKRLLQEFQKASENYDRYTNRFIVEWDTTVPGPLRQIGVE